MKTLNIKLIILFLFATIFSISLSAQSPEQIVRDAEYSINQKMDKVHSLAAQKQIEAAVNKLDEINKEIKKEITWRTFDDKYREAKRSNPSFSFHIREDLPAQLEPSFWIDYEARCDRILSNQEVVTEGMTSMVQLNNLDKAMAYGSQLKTMYETFTGAVENLGTANLPKFAYDLYGNMNDFIENYKKIEKAEREGIDIQTFQVDFNRMNSKARRSKDLYNKYKRHIQSNRMVITDFKANIRYINKLQKAASAGPLFPLTYTDTKYNWDYEDYQNNVKEICGEFEVYEIKCSDFKKDYSDIKSQARSNWNSTKGNIYASDDEAHKQEFLNHHTERWAEFLRQVQPVYENTYQIYCVDNSAPDTQNTDNPFDGATTGASAQSDGQTEVDQDDSSTENSIPEDQSSANNSNSGSTSQEESNGSSGNNNNGETGGNYKPPTPPKTNGNSSTSIPANAFLVGSINNPGTGQGTYKSVELKKLMTYDKIVFKLISGEMEYIQLIWRKEGGIWETEYQGNKTEFDISKGLKNIPKNTTHLNFVVNSHHNRWSTNDKPCKMEVYLIPGNKSNSESNSFYDLVNEASVVFALDYWEVEEGQSNSSNPKQKTLDLLRKADRLINTEPDFNTQLEMVELMVSTCATCAERVHAYTAKVPFMELGAKRLHRTSTTIPSASKSANTYSEIASMWRRLTRAALWGDHAFNKMYCDEQAKKYAALAGE